MGIKELLHKYQHIVFYGIFGVLTTIVNIVVYWLAAHIFKMRTIPGTLIAWVIAVLFAYITNRKWVFYSKVSGAGKLIREILSFFVCRLATGIVDWGCMFVFVDLLHAGDVFVKTASNVLVIILNFIASKLVVFKIRKEE